MAADENTPEKYVIKGLFKDNGNNIPKSTVFTQPKIADCGITINDNKLKISYNKPNFYYVKIYRRNQQGKTLVYEGYDKDYSEILTEGTFEYSIIPIVKGKLSECVGDEVVLPSVNVGKINSAIEPLPDEWWDDEFQ